MTKIGEILNAYKEVNNVSRASMAKDIGLPERRLRSIMSEGREAETYEEYIIQKWLISEGFDYIPPEEIDATVEAPVKTKSVKRKTIKETDAIGIKGDAKVLVQAYKEAKGFKTDTDAATALVKKGFMAVLKEAAE